MGSDRRGGVVSAVAPGPAADAGVRAGDAVWAVDGQPIRDVIDWWWLTAEDSFVVTVARDGMTLELPITTDPSVPLGVEFTDVVFDGVRQCENACSFCFISGLPQGLRSALYVRDDDFRLSFLSGNFITLTNLDDADVERIAGQRLSPLHVSVHAVDPEVRRRLLCPTVEDRALRALDTLLDAGIEAHIQVVLVPGINDGAVLDETLTYLAARPGILSVGCVPMGFTAHQARWDASYDARSAGVVVELIASWQTRMRSLRGTGWAYAADELHLLATGRVPPAAEYDDFPQFENGIGMVAAFADELPDVLPTPGAPLIVVTGALFAPVLRSLLAGRACDVEVLAVDNALFGGNVSVTGLLGGADIAGAIAAHGGTGTYLVPDVVVNSDGLLLDDVPADALGTLAEADVRIIGSDAASLARILADG